MNLVLKWLCKSSAKKPSQTLVLLGLGECPLKLSWHFIVSSYSFIIYKVGKRKPQHYLLSTSQMTHRQQKLAKF